MRTSFVKGGSRSTVLGVSLIASPPKTTSRRACSSDARVDPVSIELRPQVTVGNSIEAGQDPHTNKQDQVDRVAPRWWLDMEIQFE